MVPAVPTHVRKTAVFFIMLALLFLASTGISQDYSCMNDYAICGDDFEHDPWYGFILIDKLGKYQGHPDDSKVYGLITTSLPSSTIPSTTTGPATSTTTNPSSSTVPVGPLPEAGPGVSRAYCFVKQIRVFNNGSYTCKDELAGTWDTSNCDDIENIGVANRTTAFSGKYTVLGQQTKKYPASVNPALMSSADVDDAFSKIGLFVVVDDDYYIIGVDEEEYVKEMWRQEQSRYKTYESAVLSFVYTLARTCDVVGIVNDSATCKRERIFAKDLKFVGANETNVYEKNVEMFAYQPCLWFVIDYGKFVRYPGTMIVVLNKSKFGSHKGFNFFAIVDQETQAINHVYVESVFPGTYPGAVQGEVCCEAVFFDNISYQCVPVGRCPSPDEEACWKSSLEYGGCTEVGETNCFDCVNAPDEHKVNNALYTWNKNAADRLFGCDDCGAGNYTCSLGASIATSRKDFPDVFVAPEDWPSDFYESWEECGYYPTWDLSHWTGPTSGVWSSGNCNCLTGWRGKMGGAGLDVSWMCQAAACNECKDRGYGCQWETGSRNGCFNCRDPMPDGRPDPILINESVPSIISVIVAVFANESHYDGSSVKCGDNTGRGYEYVWLDPGCVGGCASQDCMLPWGGTKIDDMPDDDFPPGWNPNRDDWKLSERGGGVTWGKVMGTATFNYMDYPTDADPKNCSDWMGEDPLVDPSDSTEEPPWFWGDRYSSCVFEDLGDPTTFTCNCTRPEHEPKKHTPCVCGDPASPKPKSLPTNYDDCLGSPCWLQGDPGTTTVPATTTTTPVTTIPTTTTVPSSTTLPASTTVPGSPTTSIPTTSTVAGSTTVPTLTTIPTTSTVMPDMSATLRYYRLFNRDTVWTNTFKITPEISNVTVKECTKLITCAEAYTDIKEVKDGGTFLSKENSLPDLCNFHASSLVCDGCLYSDDECRGCFEPGADFNVTICHDYPDNDTCDPNGCNIAGGCFWRGDPGVSGGGGWCEPCSRAPSHNVCMSYFTLEQCTSDPCGFENCGWDPDHEICRTQGYGNRDCEAMCGASGSDNDCDEKTVCNMTSPVSTEGCTYDTIVMGSPGTVNANCLSCDKFRGAKCLYYATKDSCEDDLCGFKCWWWEPNPPNLPQCLNCDPSAMSKGCGAYDSIPNCNENPCDIEGGCARTESDQCMSCNFISECEMYGEASCTENPCGIGDGCGWNPDTGKCVTARSYMGLCSDIAGNDLTKCLTDAATVVPGGCWASMTASCPFGCFGSSPWCFTLTPPFYCWPVSTGLCVNCNGLDGLPVSSCYDYSSNNASEILNVDHGQGGCIRDDCQVGPCGWDPDRERCIPALTVEPGNGSGWIRSGGRTGDTGENIGGGRLYVHSGGGANVPNQSESEGFSLMKHWKNPGFGLFDWEMFFRNASIWSEVKEIYTLQIMHEHFENKTPVKRSTDGATINVNCGWQNLMSCDIDTMKCGTWTDEENYDLSSGYWDTLKKREPMENTERPDPPPEICGELCAKKVIKWAQYNMTARDRALDRQGDPWRYWNYTIHGGSVDIKINETRLGETNSRTTIEGSFTKNPIFKLSTDHGNVFPLPSHPYTHLNWFNMPNYGEDWSLQDDSANISVDLNYTINATLTRAPLAMQCLWDGCLHHTGWASAYGGGFDPPCGTEHDRVYWGDWEKRWCVGSCPCNDWDESTCVAQQSNGQGGKADWIDAWVKCMEWTNYTCGYIGPIPIECCICAHEDSNSTDSWWVWNFAWQFRCVSCWNHDRCDYPLSESGGSGGGNKRFLEEINDSSVVVAASYGTKFSISRPLGPGYTPTDKMKVNITGYIDTYGDHNVTAYIRIKAEPDLLNGFNIRFPEKFYFEYTAKTYPTEHELYRTQRTWELDECIHHPTITDFPGDESLLWCPEASGSLDYVECGDYPPYENLKPPGEKEFESQTLMCLDTKTKDFYTMIMKLRQPENAYLVLVNNPLKKWNHYYDLFLAVDKNYTWELPLYGIDAGVFWFDAMTWVDASQALGVARNFHEDEANYYDLAALYPQLKRPDREYAMLYRNFTVTNLHGVKLNKYVDVNGIVKYDREDGVYHIYFNSKTLNASVLGSSYITLFTNYRSVNVPLLGSASGGAPSLSSPTTPMAFPVASAPSVSNYVTQRKGVILTIIAPDNPKAFTNVDITVSISPDPPDSIDPERVIKLEVWEPYHQYVEIKRGDPGPHLSFMIEKSKAAVTAKYAGSGDDANGYKAAVAYKLISPDTPTALDWLVQNILLLALAFAAIVSYRFFMEKRMDYYTMMQESGLYEMLKDFFGFK
ncbi:MAG: hypothetical protein ABH834_01085 [Candidatus Altiarchaeota archaeon]